MSTEKSKGQRVMVLSQFFNHPGEFILENGFGKIFVHACFKAFIPLSLAHITG
jgi:hypothetical protein